MKIHVEFINVKDKSLIAVSDMPPEQLPDTFAINTTLEMMNRKWVVENTDPIEKSKFLQTRKLRVFLSPTTTMPPGNILFSLPTISNDVGGVLGDALPSEKILALHEDDWRQIEFVSQSFAREMQLEIADIQNIYQNERSGVGFKKVHIRKRIPNPFDSQSIILSDLEAVLRPQEKFEAVGFQRNRGAIPYSFAWKLDRSLILWGVTDEHGKVARLCVRGVPENENIARFSETFSSLNNQYKLTFVDWCRATHITFGVQAFASYFQKK